MEKTQLTLDQIRAQIADETGISPEDQAAYCFEQAYAWLEHALQSDSFGREQLPLTPGFWPWWCTYWNAVDRAFIESRQPWGSSQLIEIPGSNGYKTVGSRLQMLDIWERYHDTRYVHGNRALLERGFHQFIKSISKQSL